jgi:hypothetical protein
MRIECAVLCDAASVRDDLLHLLGAGVTRLTVPGFPAALTITFALRVVLQARELLSQHHVRLGLTTDQGDSIALIAATFDVQDAERREEEAALAAAIPLGPLQVERPGRYLIEASLDNRTLGTFPLQVRSIDDEIKGPGGAPSA